MPAVVVLPAPCRPSSRMTRGLLAALGQPALRIAEEREHLVADDFHDLLRGRQALEDRVLHRLVAYVIDKRLDDLEVDVGFEKRETNLAQRGFDVLGRQPPLACQRLEERPAGVC
ncbi:MAG: hypothetical protein QM736_00105 [Vicinamibacterales bacterium]